MTLTDVQKKYGLRLEPSDLKGYFWLRTSGIGNILLSNDKRHIEEVAHAYLMGAMDWMGKECPLSDEVTE